MRRLICKSWLVVVAVSSLLLGACSAERSAEHDDQGTEERPDLVGTTMQPATVNDPGFSDTVFVSGLGDGTQMAFAPDGRLFVSRKAGQLRVIKNGALLATPFL